MSATPKKAYERGSDLRLLRLDGRGCGQDFNLRPLESHSGLPNTSGNSGFLALKRKSPRDTSDCSRPVTGSYG